MNGAPWVFACSPASTSCVRVAESLPSGTVLALPRGSDTYVKHIPNSGEPARGVLLRGVFDGEAVAVLREATLLGPLLNEGRGIDVSTRNDLRAAGLKVWL